jgi:hypothetical protein
MWHSILCHDSSYVWDLVPAHLVIMFALGSWCLQTRVLTTCWTPTISELTLDNILTRGWHWRLCWWRWWIFSLTMRQSPSYGRVPLFNSVVLWFWYLLKIHWFRWYNKILYSLYALWYQLWEMDPGPHMLCIRFCPHNRVWHVFHMSQHKKCLRVPEEQLPME